MMSIKSRDKKSEQIMENAHSINLNNLKNISNDYILLNETEIYEFIKDMDDFVGLINDSLRIFKKYFPNAKYYLALEEDCECSDLDDIVAYIVNKDGTFDENYKTGEILFKDLLKLKNIYPDAWLKFDYIVEDDDEYYELWIKGIIDNY